MRRRIGRILLAAALAALLLLLLGRGAAGFYAEILWYDGLGYLSTFWTRFGLGTAVRVVAAAIGAGVVFLNLWWVARHVGPVRLRRRYGNLEIAERIPRERVLGIALAIAVLGGWWLAELQFGDAAVLTLVSWLWQVPWGVADPLFGRDIAFYVFGLPAMATIIGFLIMVTVWTLALVALGHVLVGGIEWVESRLTLTRPARIHLALLVAGLLALLAARFWLARYFLVVDGSGVGGGIGFTDVDARLPVYAFMTLLTLAAAGSVVYGAWRTAVVPPVVGLGALLAGGLLLTTAWPAVVQKFQVEPNELTREAPYIRWNMEFTRRAFGLDEMRRERFPYSRAARPSPGRIEPLLARLPLWDPAPLEQTFNEIQSLFPYYRFPDVDYDRYGEPGRERQVGIGVREFQPDGLEPAARTWQSLHLNPAYIRGMGAVVAAAHGSEGGDTPDLWVRNINPVISDDAAPPLLALDRPSVFFGETLSGYAIIVPGRDGEFTGEPGVDYPSGIALRSFARRLAFAWLFGDETLLFSGDVTRESRLLFRRSLAERLEALAPFILWDRDPLPVILDGSIVWLVDGYTVTRSYPMSRAITLGRGSVRYLRASVKAAVDAVTGDVTLYAVDEDPILATYRRIFPRLVQPMAAMPDGLRRHLRYPRLAFDVQAEVLQEYHLQRVEAFYAGQDVWSRPQQAAPGGGLRSYTPLYALLPMPRADTAAYLVVLPFIARARQNMTALLTARNDADRYGELTLFELPRDQQIPGPGQIQAVIEQDQVIAPQLSLLRQRGSGVDMGHLRVVLLDSTVLYIQPLFLSADANAIPELWRVVVSDGQGLFMGRTLADGLAGLDLPVDTSATAGSGRPVAGPNRSGDPGMAWPVEALLLLESAQERLRAGDWAGYGDRMDELRTLLERLSREQRER